MSRPVDALDDEIDDAVEQALALVCAHTGVGAGLTHRRHERVQVLLDTGDGNHVIGNLRDAVILFAGDGNDRAFPRFDFFQVAHDLVEDRATRHQEDRRRVLIHQRDRAVLHLAGGVALGVDVGDLLELERPLERGREVVPSAQIQEVGGVLVLLGDPLDLRGALQRRLDVRRQRLQRLGDLAPPHHGQITLARELQREERQRDLAVLRALGASKSVLTRMQAAELWGAGALAGALAAVLALALAA